jgi:hypothetical protein
MPLTDVRVRNAKAGDKAYKLQDGAGMYVLVTPGGARYWRLDYRFAGKRRTIALGVYPTVSLSRARVLREAARTLVAANVDPGLDKKAKKLSSQARPRSKPLPASGFLPTAEISRRGIMHYFWLGSSKISFRRSAGGPSRILMPLSYWTYFGP